jgi:tight adherence protein C
MALLLSCFVAVFVLLFGAGLLAFQRGEVAERLRTLAGPRNAAPGGLWGRLTRSRSATIEQVVKPFQNVIPRSAANVSLVQKRMIRAGYRQSSAVNLYFGAKTLVPLALCVLATVTGAYRPAPLFVYAMAVAVGFLAPDWWLKRRTSKRRLRINTGLPEALDLMVVCSEAGLGLDQALHRVADELKLSQPEIRDELKLTILEQNAGRSREEAFKNLADRTNCDSVRAWTNALIQADAFGASIAKSLRGYSDSLRTQRRQRAEEQAAKATVKLVFPLVFFIFPSIFVVTVGPSVISLIEGFRHYLEM